LGEEDSYDFCFVLIGEVDALVAIALIDDDDSKGILLLIAYPADFVIVVLVSEVFDAINESPDLLWLWRFIVLELHQTFLC
jgi:hypothetical protein